MTFIGPIILAILFLVSSVAGATSRVARGSLKGVKEISVLVENLPGAVSGTGLTVERLKTDVELRLRQSRVRVVPAEVLAPDLYINVNPAKTPCGWIFSIDLEFQQGVTLENKSFSVAATWTKGGLFSASPDRFLEVVRQSVADLVDEFLNDYLAENPR